MLTARLPRVFVTLPCPNPQHDAWFLDPVLTADMADEPVGALLDLSNLVQADKNLQVGAGSRQLAVGVCRDAGEGGRGVCVWCTWVVTSRRARPYLEAA